MVKSLPAMQETQVRSLGQKDPLEKEMAPTPVFLPGEFHGQRSLVGYSSWGRRVGHDWVTNTSHLRSHLKKLSLILTTLVGATATWYPDSPWTSLYPTTGHMRFHTFVLAWASLLRSVKVPAALSKQAQPWSESRLHPKAGLRVLSRAGRGSQSWGPRSDFWHSPDEWRRTHSFVPPFAGSRMVQP